MSVRIFSAALSGIDAQLIEVEVDSSPGIHSFNIVGLANKAVQESKDRIGSAIKNTGLKPPKSKTKKVTVSLAPADLKKEGPAYDLPIAIGYLFETGQLKFDPSKCLLAGELSLDGRLKPTSGILAMTLLAKKLGFNEVIIPANNAKEAAIVKGVDVIGAITLGQVISHLNRMAFISPVTNENFRGLGDVSNSSFLSIQGQNYAKRALIVAATGSHNVFMSGPPGSGKTLLAKALTDILPPLSFEEAIEVAKIYSSIGLMNHSAPLSFSRPFRNPHHTTSAVAVVGGGSWPRPGEISLAHRGVLFLDELPEFPRNVLEALRQPIEDGVVTISRVSVSVKLPAKFMLVAAMNPCPCGNLGNPKADCICMPFSILKYKKKISGPLLDRIDIQVEVSRETVITETQHEVTETQKKLEEMKKTRINMAKAKEIQLARFKNLGIFSNAEMSYKNLEKLSKVEPDAKLTLKKSINQSGASLRTYHKILKIARTVADLEGSETVKNHHITEALAFRIKENTVSEI